MWAIDRTYQVCYFLRQLAQQVQLTTRSGVVAFRKLHVSTILQLSPHAISKTAMLCVLPSGHHRIFGWFGLSVGESFDQIPHKNKASPFGNLTISFSLQEELGIDRRGPRVTDQAMSDGQALLAKVQRPSKQPTVTNLHFIQAQKKETARGGFFGGGGTSRYEEAAELYTQAANAFRLQKLGKEAGQALEKAAACQMKTDERDDAANTLVEAYKSYRRTDPADAARVLKQAIGLLRARGIFDGPRDISLIWLNCTRQRLNCSSRRKRWKHTIRRENGMLGSG